ncbi:FxSxx-COOH system tetratricopeptide repeat protein [Streptomyces sp. 7R007]
MIERLLRALGDLGQEPTAEELADALWLAERHRVGPLPSGPGAAVRHSAPPPGPDSGLVAPLRERDLHKALQPLRNSGAGTRRRPAEAVLAESTASGTFLPLPPRPAPPRREVDLTLVVDAGPSMVLWQPTISRFRTLMARSGVFDQVRTWLVAEAAAGGISVRTEGGASGRRAAEIVIPSRRQLVLVLSDCVSGLWRPDGAMRTLLPRWGRRQPVAIVQMLPQRMWRQSALTPVPVRWQCGSPPGTANTMLTCRRRDDDTAPQGVAIPVLELAPRWLNAWTTILSGTGAGWVNGVAHLVGRHAQAPEAGPPVPGTIAPADRIRRFLLNASPEAADLAGYLAAVAPLTLPVMGVIQRRMAPHTLPAHLAEVFLGGLLRRVDGQGPDGYDFHPGVRELLLARLTRAEVVRTVSAVEDILEARQASAVRSVTREVMQSVHVPAAATPLTPAAPEPVRGHAPVTAPRPRVWGAVPSRNPRFVGREALLDQLRTRLVTGRAARLTCSLHGMGGVGKTQLAVEYVHRYADQYDLVWWIPAQQRGEIRASLTELSVRLGLPGPHDSGEPWTRALDALHGGDPYERWLVVFDNADRPEDIEGYVPQGPGHLIITSRNSVWSLGEDAVDVGVMSPEESVLLLHRHIPQTRRLSDADALRFADVADGLPMALVQAAEFRAWTHMSVDEHLRGFENVHVLPALQGQAPARGVPIPLYRTWRMAIDRLHEEHPAAVQLLELCSFFAPEPVPLSLLRTPDAEGLPKSFAATLCDAAAFHVALRELSRFALIQHDFRRGTVQVHRLMQAVVRGDGSPMSMARRVHVAHVVHCLLLRYAPRDPRNRRDWGRFKEIQPHLLPSGVLDCETEEVRRLAVTQAQYLDASGDRLGAQELREAALRKWRTLQGPDSPDVRALERIRLGGETA